MKTIIWDVDDVLNDFMFEWFEKDWLKKHPECKLKFTDLTENPPHVLIGVSLEEYRNSLDDFRRQYGPTFNPIPEVLEWFQANGSNYRHIALTAVPIKLAHISSDWVFRNFGNWIRSFNIVPSPRKSDPEFCYDTSKKEFLQWFAKGDLLVDDNLTNIDGGRRLGLKVVIVPKPWNNSKHTLIEALQLI